MQTRTTIHVVYWDKLTGRWQMKKIQFQRIALSLILGSLLLVSGCATSSLNFGRLMPDDQVKKTFESFTVNPAYHYYYYGRINFPEAVVGISKAYTLASEDWRSINLTPEHLQNWIWLHARRLPSDLQSYGSTIIGPNGNPAGVWYSLESWHQWARIEFTDDTTIRIGGPLDGKNYRMLFGTFIR